jgi:hypothetical protein
MMPRRLKNGLIGNSRTERRDEEMTTTIHTLASIARAYGVTRARTWQWYREGRLPGHEMGEDGRIYWMALPPRPEARGRGKKKIVDSR